MHITSRSTIHYKILNKNICINFHGSNTAEANVFNVVKMFLYKISLELDKRIKIIEYKLINYERLNSAF